MGYSTDFSGAFTVTPPLKPEHSAYLAKFAETRRMKRDAAIAETLADPVRLAVGLPIGHEGAYFVGGCDDHGNYDASVIDGNQSAGLPSHGKGLDFREWSRQKEAAINAGNAQPGLWCQWVPNVDGSEIEWDGGEKFTEYEEWLNYIIRHFLAPWGYQLNGEMGWSGDESEDHGVLYVRDNVVEAVMDSNPGPSWNRIDAEEDDRQDHRSEYV